MVFDWDRHNLKKIGAHRVEVIEVEQALSLSPILIYEQDVDGEPRLCVLPGDGEPSNVGGCVDGA